MKRVIIVFAVLVVGLSIGLWVKVRQNQAATRAPPGGNGVIEGVEVDVGPRMPGRLLKVAVREGQAVRAGQVLAELDCREPRAALAAARARLEVARQTAAAARAQLDAALGTARAASASVQASGAQRRALQASQEATSKQEQRIRQLKGSGSATEVELDRISAQAQGLSEQIHALQAQRKAARGQAAAARARAEAVRKQAEGALAGIQGAQAGVQRALVAVEECTLRSPISGQVLVRAYEPGEVVLPGSRVLTVVRLDEVRTTFYLPNRELAAAAPGRRVTVKADAYPERSFSGTILSVSAEAEFTPRNIQTREDRDRLVYKVEVTIPNPKRQLRPGMPVEVSIPPRTR
jgi:HlyD family secretion protein